jgi:hypothetical protein
VHVLRSRRRHREHVVMLLVMRLGNMIVVVAAAAAAASNDRKNDQNQQENGQGSEKDAKIHAADVTVVRHAGLRRGRHIGRAHRGGRAGESRNARTSVSVGRESDVGGHGEPGVLHSHGGTNLKVNAPQDAERASRNVDADGAGRDGVLVDLGGARHEHLDKAGGRGESELEVHGARGVGGGGHERGRGADVRDKARLGGQPLQLHREGGGEARLLLHNRALHLMLLFVLFLIVLIVLLVLLSHHLAAQTHLGRQLHVRLRLVVQISRHALKTKTSTKRKKRKKKEKKKKKKKKKKTKQKKKG